MYEHDHSHENECSLRPKGSRLEDSESALAMNAALAGRFDAAGPAGVVGLQRAAGNAGTAARFLPPESARWRKSPMKGRSR